MKLLISKKTALAAVLGVIAFCVIALSVCVVMMGKLTLTDENL